MKAARTGLAAMAVAGVLGAGCGDDSDGGGGDEKGADAGQYAAVKSYLTDHSANLVAQTDEMKQQGAAYHRLAKAADFDYDELLRTKRKQVAEIIESSQATFRKANPAYEEMEGIVAGVPSLAQYDVDIDAGASGQDDPENAVSFDVETEDGKTLKKPGNFFFLTETSLFGTNKDFTAKGVKADLDGDGKVTFPEALPDANFYVAATRDFHKMAQDLDKDARAFQPTESDVFTAVVVMTPTMSEYFGAWKNSRFVAGDKAKEQSFAAASRLQDIADILSGLVLVYDNIEQQIAAEDPEQAKQTGADLERLRDFAAKLRDQERKGKRFSPEEADTLGAEAQERAEAIAGQVTQAGAKLKIKIEEG